MANAAELRHWKAKLLCKMKRHDISRDFEDEAGLYIASDFVRQDASVG